MAARQPTIRVDHRGVEFLDEKTRGDRPVLREQEIIDRRAPGTQMLAVRGLENWLRG